MIFSEMFFSLNREMKLASKENSWKEQTLFYKSISNSHYRTRKKKETKHVSFMYICIWNRTTFNDENVGRCIGTHEARVLCT